MRRRHRFFKNKPRKPTSRGGSGDDSGDGSNVDLLMMNFAFVMGFFHQGPRWAVESSAPREPPLRRRGELLGSSSCGQRTRPGSWPMQLRILLVNAFDFLPMKSCEDEISTSDLPSSLQWYCTAAKLDVISLSIYNTSATSLPNMPSSSGSSGPVFDDVAKALFL